MRLDHGAVIFGPGDRDFEFTAQELELRMVCGPLADQLGIGAGISNLIPRSAGEVIGGDVADRVAGGLDGVQANFAQGIEHIGHVLKLGPVILDVLAGGEMAVTFVPLFGQQGELAHLRGIQRAIRDRHAQHIGMQLQVEPVHQAQRFEFVFGQIACDAAFDLGAKLGVPLRQKGGVKFGILIHLHGPLVCHGRSWMARCGGILRGNVWGQGHQR